MQNDNKSACSNWGVIFDIDGTMVDNAEYHQQAWVELGRRYNKPITAEFYRKHIHSRSNLNNIRIIFGDTTRPEMIEKLGGEKEAIYRQSFRPVIKEIRGLTNLLKALNQSSVGCAAASNSPKPNVDMVLDELDIRKYFQVVIDHDQVRKGKPDPEILLSSAAKLGIKPAQCVVIEDSISGFKAAEQAGMAYIVILAGADRKELKSAAGARAMYEDFSQITPASLKAIVTSQNY